jgi:hypothetical protein
MVIAQFQPDVSWFCANPNKKLADAILDPSSWVAQNYLMGGWTLADDAPKECHDLPTNDTSSSVTDLCRVPLSNIVSKCPWNGGDVRNACGKFWLQSCPLENTCPVGDPIGNPI